MKKISFFLRSFATIDHHAPYIFYLIKSKKCNVDLVFTDLNYKYNDNDFIKFFKKMENIKIINLPHKYNSKNALKIKIILIIKVILKMFPNFISLKINNFIMSIENKEFEKFLIVYASKYINKNFTGIFDYSNSNAITYIKNLINLHKGKCINLAHWIWMWENKLRLDGMLDFNKNDNLIGSFTDFDLCIVENTKAEIMYSSMGLQKKNSFLFGSARFTKEWIEIRDQIIPLKKLHAEYISKKTNILFFYPKMGQNIHSEELFRTLLILSNQDEFNIILKLHDSVNQYYINKSIPNSIKHKLNIKFVGKKYSSSELIHWSDVVFNVHSSVMFEATLKNKTLVLMNYLHSNKMWFENCAGFWSLNTRDDLINCLNKIKTDKNYKPYTEIESKFFIERINYKNKNLVDNYINLAIH